MSIFTRCSSGHDLTKPNAYTYRADGSRACRECTPPPSKRPNMRGLGTWHDKLTKNRETYA